MGWIRGCFSWRPPPHWLAFLCLCREPGSEEHLLPASPSEREIAVPVSDARPHSTNTKSNSLTLYCSSCLWQEVNCTLFLLAGYIKYGRPHAWIRSNHERLVNIGGTDSMVKDTPMKLKSISDWQSRGVEKMPGIQSRSELLFHCADFNNYTVFHELNQTQMFGLWDVCVLKTGPVENGLRARSFFPRFCVPFLLLFQVFASGMWSASWLACAPCPLRPTPSL